MKLGVLISFIVLVPILMGETVSSRDIIYSRDGEEFRGELLEIGEDEISLETISGKKVFSRGDVVKIELGGQRSGDWWRTVDDIDDTVLIDIISRTNRVNEYTGAGYVVLDDSYEITIDLDGNFSARRRRVVYVLSENCKDEVAVNHMVYFPDISKAEIIHARTITPSGELLHLDDSAVERGPLNAYTPDYDRQWMLKFALGEITEGSIVDVATSWSGSYSSALDPLWLEVFVSESEPVLRKRVVIRAEAGAPIHFGESNWPSEWDRGSIVDRGNYTEFIREVEDIPAIIDESYMPPDAIIIPSLIFAAGPDWNGVLKEFNEAIELSNDDPPKMRVIVEELTRGIEDELDIAASIYKWVVSKTRIVDVSVGEYGYHPHELSRILENMSGNSFDRAFLFYNLASEAGLNVDFALASSHEKVFDQGIPSLGQLDYPLVRIDLAGDYIWAELSSKYRPMGVLPEGVHGEEAVVFSGGGLEFVHLEPPSSRSEEITCSLTGEIGKDGDLEAEIHYTYRGTNQEDIRRYGDMSGDEIEWELVELISDIHPNTELRGWQLNGLNSLDSVVELVIDFESKSYAFKAGNELMVFGIPGVTYSTWGAGTQSRQWPVWFDSPYRGKHRIELRLPRGYELYYLPESLYVSSDSISYRARFESDKRKLVFSDDYDRQGLSFEPSEYTIFKDCRRAQGLVDDISIVLRRK